jgi:DNA-binding NarL/FixJ family response regulator
MVTKQELIDKNKEMNKQLLEQEDEIQQLRLQIENLKSVLKSKKGIDMDMAHNTRLENDCLKKVNQSLKSQLSFLKENYEKDMDKIKDELNFYKDKFETKNIRGAGRKSKATKEQIELIHKLKSEGLSYNKIAKEVKLAVGTIYNIINN